MTVREIINTVSPVFEKYRDRVAAAYLFGSVSTGEATPLSDVDIAILLFPGARGDRFETRLKLHPDLCRVMKRDDVDLVFLDISGNLILQNEIIRYGILIYDGDPSFREETEAAILHEAIGFKGHRKRVMGV